eukprot:GILJ01004202.1.p1 GENE.GILJ01004202.1~~GILJ01004202.1.p1  ORF type:complete len:244 (-),score=40.49 GILJ01004202.1:173-904(-)
MSKALCLVALLALSASATVFEPVEKLDDVPAGMQYDATQPPIKHMLNGVKVGIVLSHGAEDIEVTYPQIFFANRGAQVSFITPGWLKQYNKKVVLSDFVKPMFLTVADLSFSEAMDMDFDVLLVAGGIASSTVCRNDGDAVKLLSKHFASGRLLTTICSGSELLIETGLIKNLVMTGSPACRHNLEVAGGLYQDVPVVAAEGKNLIMGRGPTDMMPFMQAIEEYLHSHPSATIATQPQNFLSI